MKFDETIQLLENGAPLDKTEPINILKNPAAPPQPQIQFVPSAAGPVRQPRVWTILHNKTSMLYALCHVFYCDPKLLIPVFFEVSPLALLILSHKSHRY